MTCEEYLILLSGHVDGMNTEAEEQQLQAHLAQCAACRARLEAYTAVDTALAQEDALPPDWLSARIRKSLSAAPEAERRKKRHPSALLAGLTAAACLALVLLALPVLRSRSALCTDNNQNEMAEMMAAESEYPLSSSQAENAAAFRRETYSLTSGLREPSVEADTESCPLVVFVCNDPATLQGFSQLECRRTTLQTLKAANLLPEGLDLLLESYGLSAQARENLIVWVYFADFATMQGIVDANSAQPHTLYRWDNAADPATAMACVITLPPDS